MCGFQDLPYSNVTEAMPVTISLLTTTVLSIDGDSPSEPAA